MAQLATLGALALDPPGFAQTKPLVLLAYLVVEGAQPRRRLADLFWPDGQGRKSLSMALTRLRRGAGDVVATDEHRVWATCASDVADLLAALDTGSWARADARYTGPFLDGVALADASAEVDEWLLATREHLADRVRHAVLELAERAARVGRFTEAGAAAERAYGLAGAAPAEPAVLERLHALLCAGRSRHAPDARRELAEYGVAVQLTTEAARARWRSTASPGAPTNLTAERTSFVGRAGELEWIADALERPEARLLTLVGPGGIGKSRLAREAARIALVADRYPGGVFAVAGGDPAALVHDLRTALGPTVAEPSDAGGDPWSGVAAALRNARALVVVDDLDGVPDAAERIEALLADTRHLTVMATARRRLGVTGERVVALAGLTVPASDAPWSEALRSDAVRLLVERAVQAQAGLDLEPQAQDAVALCRALEGWPLALELVAPWARLMSCADLVAQIVDDPDFIAADAEATPGRHRSLRSVFEASWGLLDEAERVAARRLAVFRGGFRREAAAHVAGATLATLARLVDASLVRGAPDGRFSVHALVAASLAEKLDGAGERTTVAARHRRHYLGWLASQRERLAQGHQAEVFAAAREEAGNVATVLEDAVDRRDLESVGAFLDLLDVAFEARGALAEGLHWLQRVDDGLDGADDPVLRARVRVEIGWYLHRLGDVAAGRDRTREALGLLEADGAPSAALALRARAWSNLAVAEGTLGHRDRTRPLLDRALALARQADDHAVLAAVLGSLGIDEGEQGRHAAAAAFFEEAVALHERDGRVLSAIRELGNLAIACGLQDDFERSGALLERSLALARAIGFRQTLPFTLSNLGVHHERLGDLERALDLNVEARAVAVETGQRPILVGILVNLVGVHRRLGNPAAALDAATEALALARELGLEPLEAQALEARAELEAGTGDRGWAARLLQVVLQSPATRSYTGSGAARAWAELLPHLSPDEVAAAVAYGRATPIAHALDRALAGHAEAAPAV
jgi:predicted ATPase/DNA-binding SARP family transcriptional activator